MAENQPKKTTRKRRSQQLSGAQIIFAAILAIGLILAINFSTRLASSRPLRAYYEGVEEEIEQLQQEQATLIAERDFVQSEAYVEQWARAEGKMARPGEQLVIPIAPPGSVQATPIPIVPIEPSLPQEEEENWTLWWKLFFDSDPPF